MPFIRKVVKELNCPRCNAWAQLRVEEERSDSCVLYIVCCKCKLKKYHSIMSRRLVNLIGQEEKILRQLELFDPGPHSKKLIARLNTIRLSIKKEQRIIF